MMMTTTISSLLLFQVFFTKPTLDGGVDDLVGPRPGHHRGVPTYASDYR